MQVVLGGVDIEKDETYDQAIQVERAIVHEHYRESPFALHNDIGEVGKYDVYYPVVSVCYSL